MAALIDTGYGNRNLREFVEANSSTPYKIPQVLKLIAVNMKISTENQRLFLLSIKSKNRNTLSRCRRSMEDTTPKKRNAFYIIEEKNDG